MDSITLFGRTLSIEQLKLGIVGVSVLLGLGLFVNNDWPKIQDWLDLRHQIDDAQRDLDNARAVTQTEPQIRARLATVQRNLAVLRERFPSRNQILSILLVDLSKIFKDSHNELITFQPKEFTALTQTSLRDLGKISIDITARGSYPSVLLLFDQLSRYERVLTIENPVLTPSGSGNGLGNDLTLSFTLTTYALNQ